eukprot:scaffold100387_cov20-Tisochrysis_lutea.AAC.1
MQEKLVHAALQSLLLLFDLLQGAEPASMWISAVATMPFFSLRPQHELRQLHQNFGVGARFYLTLSPFPRVSESRTDRLILVPLPAPTFPLLARRVLRVLLHGLDGILLLAAVPAGADGDLGERAVANDFVQHVVVLKVTDAVVLELQ